MPSLTSLAEELLAQARKVDQILEQNNLSYPSFETDTLALLPDEAQHVRNNLVDISSDFAKLMRGAKFSGFDIAFNWTEQVVMRVLWRYNLAAAVPLDGRATYQEIANTSKLSLSLVVRTIRAAIPLRIFDEPEPGQICHTAISRLLAVDKGYYNLMGLEVEDLAPTSFKLIDAWEKFGDDVGLPDQSAFSLDNGGRTLFTVLSQEPDRAHRFDAAMKYSAEDKGLNFFHILKALDWSILDQPGSQLIDLGGGYGHLAQVLARHTQNLTFVVQDLPHVVKQGQKDLPPELADRVSFEPQNFLEAQTPRKSVPNAYMISRCLHNWSDRYVSQILRNLIPLLQKGSRLLIWDTVLDDTPVKKHTEKFNLQQDFIMATISNGKERSAEEFRRLIEVSDARFSVQNVKRPEGCYLSMIDIVWTG